MVGLTSREGEAFQSLEQDFCLRQRAMRCSGPDIFDLPTEHLPRIFKAGTTAGHNARRSTKSS